MAKNIKVKQIAFNLSDPFQKKLFDYVNSITNNFSAYGKTLIDRDMNGKSNDTNRMDHEEPVKVIKKDRISKDIAKGFI